MVCVGDRVQEIFRDLQLAVCVNFTPSFVGILVVAVITIFSVKETSLEVAFIPFRRQTFNFCCPSRI
jgi:hypothetical protein